MENKEFEIQINNYNGPLELLLKLVKTKKMDLLSINLEELANAYLDSINKYSEDDIDNASEYLLMAATLLQLKGKMLLEDPKAKEEVKITKANLIKQLAEYQQFKLIAENLREKESIRKVMFTKESDDYKEYEKPIDPTRLDGSSDPIKMIMILRKMFERTNAQKMRSGTITQVNISPEERAEEIQKLFKGKNELSFEEVFSVPTMAHFVVTLLALLDLCRTQVLMMEQTEQFGPIRIIKRGKDE